MSTNFYLPCSCGEKIKVSRTLAGQEVTCSCGVRTVVPTLRELVKLEPVEETVGTREKKSWNQTQGTIAAILLGLSVLSAIYASLQVYTSYRFASDHSVEDELREGDKMIEEATPGTLMETYDKFHTMGLGDRSPPPFAISQRLSAESAQIARKYFLASGALIALSVLVVFIPWQSRRPKSQ